MRIFFYFNKEYMAVTLVVNNTPYQYPQNQESPGWGEAATDWAIAVTDVLNNVLGPDDILQTIFTVANNVSSFSDITGLSFNTGAVRSAIIEYSVYRTSTANPSGNAESGVISIVYDNAASAGSKWTMTVSNVAGNSGLTLNITDAGQLQYKSTDINATGYAGNMHFRARSLGQI